MIAVDTNILVYAHREESEFHDAAKACLSDLAEGGRSWAIPWQCLHEFLAIVTHPRIYTPPTPVADAVESLERIIECPTLAVLYEEPGYWPRLTGVLRSGLVQGPMVHDARIAAICLLHGVDELWTADRDFARFPDLAFRNPLVRT